MQGSNFRAAGVICADLWSRTFQGAQSLTEVTLSSGFRVPTRARVLCTTVTVEEESGQRSQYSEEAMV
jgi:hypothetical protein